MSKQLHLHFTQHNHLLRKSHLKSNRIKIKVHQNHMISTIQLLELFYQSQKKFYPLSNPCKQKFQSQLYLKFRQIMRLKIKEFLKKVLGRIFQSIYQNLMRLNKRMRSTTQFYFET